MCLCVSLCEWLELSLDDLLANHIPYQQMSYDNDFEEDFETSFEDGVDRVESLGACYVTLKMSGHDEQKFRKFPNSSQLFETLKTYGWNLKEERDHGEVVFQTWSNK